MAVVRCLIRAPGRSPACAVSGLGDNKQMTAAPAKTAIIAFTLSTFLVSLCAPRSAALATPRPQAATSSSSGSTSTTPSTAKKKTSSKKHHTSSKRQSFQKAPTPARISEIQSALARNGFYGGNPSGKWDSSTVAAMQKFQSANGLEANGKINALSLQKLGLGSSIAGVSAPKPVPPPSSLAPANKPAPAPPPSTSAPAADTTSAASVSPASH
jgi:peptidoglycan hydrolase-like protein with peptidoglycan-binding domain